MTLDELEFLTSDAGQSALAWLAEQNLDDKNTLSLLTWLRRELAPEQAGAALTLARLRHKAVDKFGGDAQRMYFTDAALQQASDPLVRGYRAQVAAGGQHVVDACCGIGADSLAMARAGAAVTGLDIDPVRIEMARLNAAALGVPGRFEVADVRDGLPPCDFVFYDPTRRDEQGKRIFNVEHYQPPLSLVRQWDVSQMAVKLSPGVDLAQIAGYGGSVEFISVSGDLKEAVLWLGVERPAATLLTPSETLHWSQPEVMPLVPLAEPAGWLVEPDPALLRAGLVQDVAAAFDGAMLDETIAYFTTGHPPRSLWVRHWRILDWMPFHLKRLRAYLRGQNVGQLTIKKRGVAITPEELAGKLKLKGDEARTLVLTRLQGQPIVVICEDQAARQVGQPT